MSRQISICAYCALREECAFCHYEPDFRECDDILPELYYKTVLAELRDSIRFTLYGNTATKDCGIISGYWLVDRQKHDGLFKNFMFRTIEQAEYVLWKMVKYGLTERQGGGWVF